MGSAFGMSFLHGLPCVEGTRSRVQGILWETSLLDPEEGIRFRGHNIPELQVTIQLHARAHGHVGNGQLGALQQLACVSNVSLCTVSQWASWFRLLAAITTAILQPHYSTHTQRHRLRVHTSITCLVTPNAVPCATSAVTLRMVPPTGQAPQGQGGAPARGLAVAAHDRERAFACMAQLHQTCMQSMAARRAGGNQRPTLSDQIQSPQLLS